MLAKLGTLPAKDDSFGFEIKWDGIRALAYYEPGRFRIESRNLNDITAQYPELRRLGRQLGSRDTILDGEIVAFDEHGRPSFELLQHRMHLTREADIKRRVKEIPVQYVLFDVLYLEGRSVMARPYDGAPGAARVARPRGAELADAGLPPRGGKRAGRGQRQERPRGRRRQEARQHLFAGPAQPPLDQGQEQAARAARDRRLAAGEGARGSPRRPARRLLRPGGPLSLCRSRRHGLRRQGAHPPGALLAPAGARALPLRGQARAARRQVRRAAARRRGRVHGVDQRRDAAPPLLQGTGRGGAGVDRSGPVEHGRARPGGGSGRWTAARRAPRSVPSARSAARRWRSPSRGGACGSPTSTRSCIRRPGSPSAT